MENPFSGLSLPRPVRTDVPLAPFTTWGIGGPARWFYEPEGAEDLAAVTARAADAGVPVILLGRGSNVLIPTAGLDALVICTRNTLQDLEVVGDEVRAGAGVQLPQLARTASRAGLEGFSFLVGIPGSVGGGVTMNAGLTATSITEMCTVLQSVRVLDLGTGDVMDIAAGDLGLGYRCSAIPSRNWMVLEARFRARGMTDPGALRADLKSHMLSRRAKQPIEAKTAGSTYTQPAGGKAAGWYIEQSGLKGHKVGNAQVSLKHANWIENLGGATSDEVRSVMNTIEERVLLDHGVALSREVRLVG